MLKKAITLKRHKWKAYKAAGRSMQSLVTYKQSCLNLSKQIREQVQCHEANLVASNNLGAFYRYVNKRLKRKSSIGPLKAPTGQLCFNDLQKASLLNSHFASISTVDNGILPVCSDANVNHEPLCNITFTPHNVLKAIEKLKNNLSSGPDNIPPLLYVKLKHILCLPLSILYQQLMSVGAVPLTWKTAIIVPVFKNGDPTDVQNYRPISLTCVASKIMERVIVQQMTSYFTKCNLISDSQVTTWIYCQSLYLY